MKELLVVDGEKALFVLDTVVLDFALEADTERVVPWEVGALPHEEQSVLARTQQLLRPVPRDLPVKPSENQLNVNN